MPVSIDIPGATNIRPFEGVFRLLRETDNTFSTYRGDSEVSRFNKDHILVETFTQDFHTVYKECVRYSAMTDGYFSAFYNGPYDPSGYVKSWAMRRAAQILHEQKIDTFLINIAGDVIATGTRRTWRIAIQSPFVTSDMVGIAELTNEAMATSGTYERGNHIINPHTKKAETDIISVTVRGKDIIDVDVFATTCIAMGKEKAIRFLHMYPAYSALLILKDGSHVTINGFHYIKTQTAL